MEQGGHPIPKKRGRKPKDSYLAKTPNTVVDTSQVKDTILHLKINSNNLDMIFKFDLEVLFLHEAIPGHHFEQSINKSKILSNVLPEFNEYI